MRKPKIFKCPSCHYWHYTDFNGAARGVPFVSQQAALRYVCSMLEGLEKVQADGYAIRT